MRRIHPITQIVTCLAVLLMLGQVPSPAQQVRQNRVVHVSVTDPMNRFVTGLEKEHFDIVENGVRRTITAFSNIDSPISLAIVSDEASSTAGQLDWPGDLIRTRSLADALRQLASSKNERKAVIITRAADLQQIPSGIQVLQVDPAVLQKAVIELRNQYLIQFESQAPSAGVDVIVTSPKGLPSLKPNWK
jgi:hypothetical protein